MMEYEQNIEEGISNYARKNSKPMEGVFHSLSEERVRPYIDLIDSLRLIGIDKDLTLPTIAVIGDQSSGKSSVLEALSGVALPRGSGIVTRCPLELKLRKIKCGVQWKSVISYKEQHIEFEDPSLVENYVEVAQNELAGEGVGICDELITLEIMAPDVCDLTLIDLPGIARVAVKGQPEDIGRQIKNLILKYIEKDQTINLVVVPCNVDIATTEALKMAQEVDPEGKRTLGILTKPDLIDIGTEKNVLDIIQNQVIPLTKGYVIVKCRGQKQIDEKISLSDAVKDEREFFRCHEFFSYFAQPYVVPIFIGSCLLYEGKASIQCLATKLTQELVDHIKKSLPLVSEEIKKQLWSLRKELSQCEAGPPLDPQKRKTFFIDTLLKFTDKINSLASGEVINSENVFVLLRTEFKIWENHLDNTKASFQNMIQEVVNEYDLKHRGRELPGFSDYKVFEMMVQKLVTQLTGPAIDTLRVISDTIQKQFLDVSKTCFLNYPFLKCVATNKIENIQSNQKLKVEQRIMEQFEMEQLVYTQDGIYYNTLNKSNSSKKQKASENNFAEIASRNKYPEMLWAYYEIVVQRLADQVPMLIQYFMLKKSAQMLCSEMLGLMDGANMAEVLREESGVSRQRIGIQNRIDRLTLAQEKLNNFV